MYWYMTRNRRVGLLACPLACPLVLLSGLLHAQQIHAQQTLHLTLAEAEKLAVQNNPQLSSSHYTAAAAHQVPNEYKANLAPNVFGSFTGVGADNGSRLAAGGLNNPVVYNRLGSGLTVSQLITDFGRTGNLIGSASLRAEAQDQAAEATRARILLATGSAYFGVLRAHAVMRVAEQTVKARQDVVDQVSALAESKLKSTLDVSFAKVNLSDAKLLVTQALNELKTAEANLATAMGLPNETAFDLQEETLPPPLPDRIVDLVRQAMADRPDLKDLRLEQSSEQRFAKAEHDLYYPSVGVLATAGFAPAGEVAIPGRYGAIGLNVNIPIFNGGLFKARQSEAELRARAAGDNITDLENRVTRDVRVAYYNATTAYDRMALTKQLVDQAAMALDLAQVRYENGLGTIVELSTAQLNLTSAQIADTNARYEYQAQRVNVDYQVGALR
jgi:outer membrane protein